MSTPPTHNVLVFYQGQSRTTWVEYDIAGFNKTIDSALRYATDYVKQNWIYIEVYEYAYDAYHHRYKIGVKKYSRDQINE